MTENPYNDILYLSRPVSEKHIPMPAENRAAQFAPFAALTGYEDAIRETERLTQEKSEQDEYEREALDERLHFLEERIKERPEILLTYFVPDEKKQGGRYVQRRCRLKKIDAYEKQIISEDGTQIRVEDIIKLDEISPFSEGEE